MEHEDAATARAHYYSDASYRYDRTIRRKHSVLYNGGKMHREPVFAEENFPPQRGGFPPKKVSYSWKRARARTLREERFSNDADPSGRVLIADLE